MNPTKAFLQAINDTDTFDQTDIVIKPLIKSKDNEQETLLDFLLSLDEVKYPLMEHYEHYIIDNFTNMEDDLFPYLLTGQLVPPNGLNSHRVQTEIQPLVVIPEDKKALYPIVIYMGKQTLEGWEVIILSKTERGRGYEITPQLRERLSQRLIPFTDYDKFLDIINPKEVSTNELPLDIIATLSANEVITILSDLGYNKAPKDIEQFFDPQTILFINNRLS